MVQGACRSNRFWAPASIAVLDARVTGSGWVMDRELEPKGKAMTKISVAQRMLAAVASITVSIGMAQGMTELARYESGSRWMTQGAAPPAGIVCAPVRSRAGHA